MSEGHLKIIHVQTFTWDMGFQHQIESMSLQKMTEVGKQKRAGNFWDKQDSSHEPECMTQSVCGVQLRVDPCVFFTNEAHEACSFD